MRYFWKRFPHSKITGSYHLSHSDQDKDNLSVQVIINRLLTKMLSSALFNFSNRLLTHCLFSFCFAKLQ